MSGGFLPPVVTTLDGDIQPLLDELAKAKAAIKALKSDGFVIPITAKLDTASLGREKAKGQATINANPLTWLVKPVVDDVSLLQQIQATKAFAAANPIIWPVKPEWVGYAGPPPRDAIMSSPARLAIGPGTYDNPALFRNFDAGVLRAFSGAFSEQAARGLGPGAYAAGRILGWSGPVYGPANNYAMRPPLAIEGPASPMVIQGGVDSSYTPFASPGFWGRMGGGIGNFWNDMTTLGGGSPPQGFRLPWWFGGRRLSYAASHLGLLGLGGLGMGAVGGLIGLGSMGAVYGNAVGLAARQAQGLFQAQEALIPPGVPDYALARAFGLTNAGANSPLGQASAAGRGIPIAAYGTLLQILNRKGPLAGLIANTGTAGGLAFTNWLSGMAGKPMGSGSVLSKLFSSTLSDAINISSGFGNLGATAGHIFSHMPGEIEWLTNGFRLGTGWINNAFTTPGLKTVVGDALFGGMLWHSTGLLTKLLRGGIGGLGSIMSKVPGLRGLGGIFTRSIGADGALATLGTDAGLFGTSGFVGTMLNPVTMAAAAILGGGLALYRHQNPTSAAINAINSHLYNVGTGEFANNILGSMALFSNGAAFGGQKGNFWLGNSIADHLFPNSNWRWKWASPSMQNQNALWNAQQEFFQYGSGVDAVAKAMHISTSQAANLMASAGVMMGKNGKIDGGNAQAIRLARAYWNANGILNGQIGEVGANMGIGNVVNDSAWKQASQINSNWDAFMNNLTGGGVGLGNLWSVLARTNPTVEKNMMAPIGIVPTAQGIQSAGQPLMDFFRMAQSVGSIGGIAFQNSSWQLAASMGSLAGRNPAAQSMLVALANEGGGFHNKPITSFSELMKISGGPNKALKDIQNSIAATTIAMSKVPVAAQTMAQSVTQNIVGMSAAIVAKSPAAQNAFNQMTTAMEKFGTGSKQAAGWAGALALQLLKNKMPAQSVIDLLKQLHINMNALPANVRKELHIVTNAQTAGDQIKYAHGQWTVFPNGQTKTNSIVTKIINEYSSVYLPGKGPLPIGAFMGKNGALGLTAGPRGNWGWIGENGPEIMYTPPGGSIIPNHHVGQALANMGHMGAGGGDTHVHVYLDSKELFGAVKTQTFKFNNANGNRAKGGRVRGTMAPRN